MQSELTPQAITGVVLAGGRSRRMGQNKALLQLNGETLLARAKRLLTGWGCGRVVVSGHYPDEICIADNGEGPLAGLLACLQQESAPWLLFVPVDMPFIPVVMLDRLLAAMVEGDTHGVTFTPACFPLLLANTEAVRHCLCCLLGAGERRVQHFYRTLGLLQLPLTEAELPLFDNTNTPEQWQAALQRAHHQSEEKE